MVLTLLMTTYIVQQFFLISATFSDRYVSFLRKLGQLDTANDLILFIGHCDIYLRVRVSDFAIYLKYCLLNLYHTWNSGSVGERK